MSHEKKSTLSRVGKWSFIIAANAALLFVVGVSTARESYREWQTDQEIRGLQSEVVKLEGRKNELTDLLERLKSPEAVDARAREQLGVRKPGERVLVIKDWKEETTTGEQDKDKAVAALPTGNPQRWLYFFFYRR